MFVCLRPLHRLVSLWFSHSNIELPEGLDTSNMSYFPIIAHRSGTGIFPIAHARDGSKYSSVQLNIAFYKLIRLIVLLQQSLKTTQLAF